MNGYDIADFLVKIEFSVCLMDFSFKTLIEGNKSNLRIQKLDFLKLSLKLLRQIPARTSSREVTK